MILILEGTINQAIAEKLADAYNELRPDEILHIYLASGGGSVSVARIMIDMINANQTNTILTGFNIIASAAFEILLSVKCKKQIVDDTIGMVHLYSWSVDFRDDAKPKDIFAEFQIKQLKKSLKERLEFFKSCRLTTPEIETLKTGQDLYLTTERLRQIIK